MSILQALLQSVGGGGQGAQDDPGPDIMVQAERKRNIAEDDRIEPGPRKTDELIQRKGLFGVKGTLRDILGTVGDAFLLQSGNKPIYRPQREKEKLASAVYGMTDDPKAAIERAAVVDPGAAIEMNQQYQTNETQRLRAAQLAEAQRAAIQQKGYGIAGALAHTIKDPDSYKQAKPILDRMKSTYGLDFDVPEEYDQNALSGIFTRGLSPDQISDNERADRAEASRDEQRKAATRVADERLYETRRHNTAVENKPSASRGSNPTAASLAAPILKKVERGETLTPAQQEVLDRTGFTKDRGKGKASSRRAPPPLPPGFVLKK